MLAKAHLMPSADPHVIPVLAANMPALSEKRKKTTSRIKIHVKGAASLTDAEDETVKKAKKRRIVSEADNDGEDEGPRASHEDESSDESDSEQTGDGQSKKIKSKEERKSEKVARKEKRNEKIEEKNKRTIFVGNIPSSCEPRVSLLCLFQLNSNINHAVSSNLQELRKHFIKCGAIESVRLRGIIPSNPKIPKKAAAVKSVTSLFQPSFC